MPSEKVLKAKQEQVAAVSDKLKASVAGVIIDYRGLTVEEDTNLRRKFREAGVEYKVIKNSILGRAAEAIGLEGLEPALHGPTALAMHNEDVIAPAKIIADFAKDNDKIEIKTGFMEGEVISLDEIKKLASTPSKEVLIAKMMGSLNSPASSLARLLNTIVEGGVEIADLIAKKAAESAPAEETAPAEEATPVEEAAPAEETPAAE